MYLGRGTEVLEASKSDEASQWISKFQELLKMCDDGNRAEVSTRLPILLRKVGRDGSSG